MRKLINKFHTWAITTTFNVYEVPGVILVTNILWSLANDVK